MEEIPDLNKMGFKLRMDFWGLDSALGKIAEGEFWGLARLKPVAILRAQ